MTKHWCVAVLLAALVAGCGSDEGEGGATPNSTILILPTAINYQPYYGNILPATLGPDPLTVTVLNANGNPVRGATVTMYHAGNNSMISADSNGNFLNFQPEPYIATTDDFGKIYLYVLTPASSALGASSQPFQAFSGSAYNTINVNMTCVDSDTSTSLTCN